MPKTKILSLDGGGIKGTFGCAFLAECERLTGKRLVEYFDIMIGTSTGAIIAVALAMGICPQEILNFYIAEGPNIFPSSSLVFRLRVLLHAAFRPRYTHDALKDALSRLFGPMKLGESRCRLVIVSYDAVAGDVHLFKTAHHPKFRGDYEKSAVEVLLATAAAPTYFPALTTATGSSFVDGGVWANCPAALGAAEAIGYLGKGPDEIEVLSVGTTSEPFHVSKARRLGGLLQWNIGIVDLIMQAQIAGALAQCKVLTNHKMLRINALTKPGRFSLDGTREVSDLRALGVREARHNVQEISDRFLKDPVEPFRPCYPI